MNQSDKDIIKLLLLTSTFDELREVRSIINSIWDDKELEYSCKFKVGEEVHFLNYEYTWDIGWIYYFNNKTIKVINESSERFTIPVSNLEKM